MDYKDHDGDYKDHDIDYKDDDDKGSARRASVEFLQPGSGLNDIFEAQKIEWHEGAPMAEGPSLHPKLQVASNIPIELSSQIPQDPARNLAFQMCQNPLMTPGSTMQSRLSVPKRNLLQQESQGPTRQSGRMPLSDRYVNKQTGPMALRKFRKERTVYSKEQQCLLQKHFDEFQYPNEKKIVELALSVGVTKREIKIWFKNNRAKYRRMKLQNIKQALPETNESSKAVSESTHFPGSIPVVDSDNGESMCSGTFGEDSIPKLNCSQESSLHCFQACDGDMCCPQEYQEYQEYLLHGHAPVTAWNSGQSAAFESQTDLAVAEVPVGLAYAAQAPEDAHNSGPCEDELWQRILEDLDTSDDWLTLRNLSTPVYTTEVLDQSKPYSHEEVCYTHL